MTQALQNCLLDDLLIFSYDLPAVSDPAKHVICGSSVHINDDTSFAQVHIADTYYPVVGITAAGWIMIAGLDWRLLQGDAKSLRRIASACNRLQSILVSDRPKFDLAYDRHMARRDTGQIAGLRETHLGDGRYAVRPRDIVSHRVRDRLCHFLTCYPAHDGGGYPSVELPSEYIGSDIWWRFAWLLKHSPVTAQR